MVRYTYDDEKGIYGFTGKSTDVKPTTVTRDGIVHDVVQGSTFFAMDTSSVYMFDGETKSWFAL